MRFITLITAVIISVNMATAEVKTFSNFKDKNDYPLIIPEVQKLTPLNSSFTLPDSFTLVPLKGSKLEVEIIKNALSQRFPKIKLSAASTQSANCRLQVTTENVPEADQGYRLKINKDGIEISARSAVGIFYGAQTLANIIRNADSRTLKGCDINDYPDLKLRGVFFNLRSLRSKWVNVFKQTIDDLAALKYNCLVLEFADNFPLQDNPFTKRDYTLSKEDVLEIVNYARERHFEVIPHLQLLSHVAWLLKHPDFQKSMTEGKPTKTWLSAYCPSNEKVIKLVFKVLKESIALLKPKYYHICLDELNYCPWRQCPKCKKRDSAELFTEHVKLLEKKIFELGSTPMIYHDTFCKKYIGEKTLAELDRRDVIAFWRYENYPNEEMFKYFAGYGFPIMGVSYCKNVPNSANMPKLLVKYKKGLGCYLTYWSYAQFYLQRPEKSSKDAYAGTVVAGNFFWKANGTPYEQIAYDPSYQMRRIIDPEIPERRADSKAVSVAIAGEFNMKFGGNPNFPLFSSDKKLNAIKKALAESPEKFNLVTTSGGRYYGIMLANNKNAAEPKKVEIPLNVKTDQLSFLMTASRSNSINFLSNSHKTIRNKVHIGDIKVNFTDGSSNTIPLMFRLNIEHWNTDIGTYGARLAMLTTDDNNSICSFNILDFDNPEPGKTVKSLTFSSNCKYDVAPVLLAVSAFDTKSTFKPIDVKKLSAVREQKIPEPEDKIFADFESGMGTMKFSTQNKYISIPKYSIVQDMTAPIPGKVLKIQAPQPVPVKDSRGRLHEYARVIVDIKIPAKTAGKTLRFDFKTDNPEKIYKSGAYVGNSGYSKYKYMFNFHNPQDKGWTTVYIPIDKMVKDKSACKQDEITMLRVSFWTLEPMNIWIDNIGTSENSIICLPYKTKK